MLKTELAPDAVVAVFGKAKGSNEVYDIIVTSKSVRRDALKSAVWTEHWTLELGADEDLKPLQTFQGTIKLVAHCSEEGSAELSMSRKLIGKKLGLTELKSGAEGVKTVAETVARIVGEEEHEVWKALIMNAETIKPIVEEKVRRKCGRTGGEYKAEMAMKQS